MKNIILLTLIAMSFILSSCASYVHQMHRQIDRDERIAKGLSPRKPRYPQRPRYQGQRRPIQNPITLGGSPNTRNTPNLAPKSNRNFDTFGRRRVTAEDLKDKEQSSSLWTGNHSESFLFVTNNIKRAGDIVIVEVMSPLKDTIQDELKRTFPAPRKKGKKGEEAKKEEKPKEEVASSDEDPNKVHDKISTQVIEEINKDYLLVRGRKEVMYKTKKRFIEFQALVSRKDITNDDAVKSTKVLEPKVSVVRY